MTTAATKYADRYNGLTGNLEQLIALLDAWSTLPAIAQKTFVDLVGREAILDMPMQQRFALEHVAVFLDAVAEADAMGILFNVGDDAEGLLATIRPFVEGSAS